jgi:repressor LexA
MTPNEFKKLRNELGLTQEALAARLQTTRMTITRYEGGTRRIPGVVQVALGQLSRTAVSRSTFHDSRLTSVTRLPMAGVIAAGSPIEPIAQTEFVEVPSGMIKGKDHFVLKVKGDSMKEEGILPGDLVIVRKQAEARNGQAVVGLLNREATLKKYYRRNRRIELHPANAAMKPIVVRAGDDFQIQGIVTGIIRFYE